MYLTLYGSSNQSDYDGDGCLKRFNDLSIYHNQLLRQGICDLQSKHTDVRLMYGDFYSQVTEMVRSPVSFGKYMIDHAVASTPHNEPIFVALAKIVYVLQ
jgi:phospholipase/lecithinase/hemolysin